MIDWLGEEPRDLALLPMAARRALDRAGLKVSLEPWQAMPLEGRRRLAELGSAPEVDVEAVRAAAPEGAPMDPVPEPDPRRVPDRVAEHVPALGDARWAELSPVARHALEMYARKGRGDKARATYEALMSPGASQSSR